MYLYKSNFMKLFNFNFPRSPCERRLLSHCRRHGATLSLSPPSQPPETTTTAVVPSQSLSTTSIKRIQSLGKEVALRLHKPPPQGWGSLTERFIYQMESMTKWDLRSLQTYYSVEPYEKFQEDEFLDISLLPRLQEELWKAQSRIKELEAEKFGSMDNTRSFTNDALVEYLKEELRKEKKETKRAKAENSISKKKIWEMELSTNRLRRERNTMEKVCEELVTRIDELKATTRRLWEEMNEERQLLHMAEMWREERVRIKLMDAKLDFQEKYEEMNLLVVELEKSLKMAREVGGIEETKLRRGESLIKTARSFEVEHNQTDFERFRYVV